MSDPNCLLCVIDRDFKDHDERAFAYMTVTEMASLSLSSPGGQPWQDYARCCRHHAMISVRATCRLGELTLSILSENTPKELAPLTEKIRADTRRMFAKLELAVMDRYDRKEEGPSK